MKIECPAETEADSDLQLIAITSASIAANRLLAAVYCLKVANNK